MEGETRYLYESFGCDLGHFDGMFTDFINKKYGDGWKYKTCQFITEHDRRLAYCVFKKI